MDFNNKKFQITLLTFVKTGIPPFIVFIATIILFIPLMKYTYGTERQAGAWIVSIFMICFNGIPPLLLHLNYYRNDRGKCMKINKLKKIVTLYKNSQKREINFDDIEKIEKYHSNWLFRISFKSYYYYRILLKDKTSFYLSRLVIEKFENKIEGQKFEFVGVLYPFIRETN